MPQASVLEAADEMVVITAMVDGELLCAADGDGAAEIYASGDPDVLEQVEAARKVYGPTARAMSISEFRRRIVALGPLGTVSPSNPSTCGLWRFRCRGPLLRRSFTWGGLAVPVPGGTCLTSSGSWAESTSTENVASLKRLALSLRRVGLLLCIA
jgi:hypothetical protein